MATWYVVTKDGEVSAILPDLLEIDGDSMQGKGGSVHGVDLEIASIIAVEDALELKIGEKFPEGQTNVANKYIKQDPQEQIRKDMSALLFERAADKQKIAKLESMVGNLIVDIATLKGGK